MGVTMSPSPRPDESMADTALRRLLARQAIDARKLPDRPADRMWGGPGRSETCSICNLEIPPQQTAFELEFTRGGHKTSLHFLHGPCLAAWEAEWQNGKNRGPADRHVEAAANGSLNGGRKGKAP